MFAFLEGFDPLSFTPGFLIWSAVTFGIMFFILLKKGWGPLAKSIEDREAKIQGDIDSAERAAQDADAKLKQLNERLSAANVEAKQILDEARAAAETAKAGLLATARTEAEALMVKAEKDIASARDQAIGQIKAQVVDLSVTITERILGRAISADDHERLADEVLSRSGDLN